MTRVSLDILREEENSTHMTADFSGSPVSNIMYSSVLNANEFKVPTSVYSKCDKTKAAMLH